MIHLMNWTDRQTGTVMGLERSDVGRCAAVNDTLTFHKQRVVTCWLWDQMFLCWFRPDSRLPDYFSPTATEPEVCNKQLMSDKEF